MPVSREEAIAAFRDVLGRAPRSEAAIRRGCECADLGALYRALLHSPEFVDRERDGLADAASRFAQSKQPAVIFMHIPKTAGTSLHERLLAKAPLDLVCPERFDRLHTYSLAELNRYRYFSGHFAYPVTRHIPGKRKIAVTLLREPVARLVSAYRFFRAHKPGYIESNGFGMMRLARELNPQDFFADERVRSSPWFDNVAARMLLGLTDGRRWERVGDARVTSGLRLPADDAVLKAATRMLHEFAVVGLTERFEAFAALVGAAIDLDLGEDLGRRMVLADMVGASHLDAVPEIELDAELRAAIEPLVRIDRRLYEQVAEAQG